MPSTTDVIVVGGGINGTSIAFNLAKRGVKVTLVEKNFIASGPTGRSSAIIRQHYSNEVTARMALRSLRVWQNFKDAVGGEAEFKQAGFMLGAREKEINELKANIAMQQAVGINTRFVTPKEMKELEPEINLEGIVGAAYEPESGYADPASAANSYATAARQLGATILQDTSVTSIGTAGARVTGVTTTKGTLSAGAVVVAAGPWTPKLFKTVGIDVPITASRVQVVLYRWPAGFRGHMVYSDFVEQVYVRPEGKQMMVGSVEPKEAEDVVANPDQFNEQVDYAVVTKFAERIAHRYPKMESGAYTKGYSALYDITPDWHPIIDEMPGIAGLYCCAGGSGSCFKMGPAIGEMVAALVVNGKHADDDVNLFRFARFEQGEFVKGKYEANIVG